MNYNTQIESLSKTNCVKLALYAMAGITLSEASAVWKTGTETAIKFARYAIEENQNTKLKFAAEEDADVLNSTESLVADFNENIDEYVSELIKEQGE